jgi:hypothetical protein
MKFGNKMAYFEATKWHILRQQNGIKLEKIICDKKKIGVD